MKRYRRMPTLRILRVPKHGQNRKSDWEAISIAVGVELGRGRGPDVRACIPSMLSESTRNLSIAVGVELGRAGGHHVRASIPTTSLLAANANDRTKAKTH